MADDRYHEFHLEGKQLAFLFMTATAVVVVSFLIGVTVGRGVQIPRSDADAAAVIETSGDAARPAAAVPEESSASDLSARADAVRQDQFTYYDRLNRPSSVAETLREPEPVREPEPATPPAPAPAPAVQPSTPAPPARPASQPAPVRVQTPAPPSPAAPAAPRVTAAPTGRAGSGFWIQVLSVSARDQAESTVGRLASKGYPSYLESTSDGRFRVRVGTYADRDEADAVARRLETEEKFHKPWVAR
jgi:cell division septation protein DedD